MRPGTQTASLNQGRRHEYIHRMRAGRAVQPHRPFPDNLNTISHIGKRSFPVSLNIDIALQTSSLRTYATSPTTQMAYPHPSGNSAYGNAGYPQPQAPPPNGYGYAPPPGPPPFGAPAFHNQPQAHAYTPPQMSSGQGHGQLVYLGVPVPVPPPGPPSAPPPGFPAAAVVESIRKATKGFGTDEKRLIEALAPLDAWQMNAVYHTFKGTTGKDLLDELESETSGWFEAALRAKVLGPVGYDVWLVNRAIKGVGTHEDILNEVLLLRTNAEIWALKNAYRAKYNRDMERAIQDDLSFKTKRLFTMALQANRIEDWTPVDPTVVQHDVKELKAAARGVGTDEIKVSRATHSVNADQSLLRAMS